MIELTNIRRVYFIGIGGIGMSALARYFHEKGVIVSGYDRTPTSLTKNLEQSGIRIHYTEDIALLDREADLAVYTPAIPEDHQELTYYRSEKYPVWKRSDVLEAITKELFAITVAGTHGKTTISTMIAHILRHSGYGCNAFLGGLSVNYGSNFWSSPSRTAVIEADEYDRSFLKLHPNIAILSAMDPDHLDIYGTEKAMQDAFIQYANRTDQRGTLFYKYGLQRHDEFTAVSQVTYSLQQEDAQVHASDIRIREGEYIFNVSGRSWTIENICLKIGGLHNVENAVIATAVAYHLGIAKEKIKAALAGFKGVKRRFEYLVRKPGVIYIDDYAHHPEELKALITSARELFPGKACTVIFQPHLFSRTRDLAQGFAESLSLADEVILLPIYPAREKPIEGVSSEMIAGNITGIPVHLMSKAQCMEWLKQKNSGLFITAGAGDIDQLTEPVSLILNKL